jgi:protoheme ferro-lyase
LAFISLVITVVMGIMAGGMVALALIGPRHMQNIFGILALFGVVLGLAAAVIGQPQLSTLINNLLDLILSGFIGYAVTTYFVLAYQPKPDLTPPPLAEVQTAQRDGPGKIAVIYFAPGEAAQYDGRIAARGFDTIDYPEALPPTLLRPLYLNDLKRKYEAIVTSPHRAIHLQLAKKVQDRLGKRYKVYIAFYNDQPRLTEVAAEAVRDGSRRLIVLHARLTSPPPTVKPEEWLDSLRLKRYGVRVTETAPLWNSDLLPRVFVRRALAATEGLDRATVGLMLIGQGHPLPRRTLPEAKDAPPPLQRQNQELTFQKRVRQALIRAGFPDDQVVPAWTQWQHPTIEGAYAQLVAESCPRIFWIGTGLMTDSVLTLYDIPAILRVAAERSGVEVTALGPWNDDDVVAEALVERVKQVAIGD